MKTTERVVVGVKKMSGKDFLDAWGHYWAWSEGLQAWRHDREHCQITSTRNCFGMPQ